jgi:hypothetical protein
MWLLSGCARAKNIFLVGQNYRHYQRRCVRAESSWSLKVGDFIFPRPGGVLYKGVNLQSGAQAAWCRNRTEAVGQDCQLSGSFGRSLRDGRPISLSSLLR